eukprot:jgi/Mesen1/9738/ME000695S09056
MPLCGQSVKAIGCCPALGGSFLKSFRAHPNISSCFRFSTSSLLVTDLIPFHKGRTESTKTIKCRSFCRKFGSFRVASPLTKPTTRLTSSKSPYPHSQRGSVQTAALHSKFSPSEVSPSEDSLSKTSSLAGMGFGKLTYPPARRDESVVEDYHGTPVADPYRWLEDPDAEETQKFVASQNELTGAVLASCETREKFREKMTELYNYPKYGCPFKYGGRVFYFYNSGLQAQSVLYMQVLLDPNALSADGTVALSAYAFSESGALLAYGLSASGSDWQSIRVMRVEAGGGRQLDDELAWVKFSSIAWTHDERGFFYNRYPGLGLGTTSTASSAMATLTDINLHQQLCYHVLGTPQSDDVLCWQDPENPQWMFGAEVSDDGQYLVVSISAGCDPVNRLYYVRLDELPGGIAGDAWRRRPQEQTQQDAASATAADGEEAAPPSPSPPLLPLVKLVDNFEAQYSYVTNEGTSFTFHTNKDAPLYKLTRVDLREPATWTDVVPEAETGAVLEWVRCVNRNLLLTCYLHDVKHQLQLPLDIGSVRASSGRKDDTEVFYSFASFLTPGTIFRCDVSDVNSLEPLVFREIKVEGFDASAFETRQVFVDSKDGTSVPMFVVARKGLQLDGSHPALLYGYGGFNISITPSFSVARVLFMRHYGGVVAIANIRGGGEYGDRWHKAGALGAKQNCFDDFQSCAEHLIRHGYTSPPRLTIEGGSNGGLLVAACINQRPDLFGCAVAHVGVMDMLRFHKFTIGHAWTTDYGCSDKPDEFQWLIRYSPLHNVRRPWEDAKEVADPTSVQYPATMVLTGDHDDRVVPLHSLKLVATLHHTLLHSVEGESPQTNPIIARIETKAGHGAGRPTKKIIDEVSDIYSFVAKVTGATWED